MNLPQEKCNRDAADADMGSFNWVNWVLLHLVGPKFLTATVNPEFIPLQV